MIRFADSLRDIRKSLVVRGMSRAGGQIPGLAALDLKIRYAMDLAGLAALDLQWNCDGNGLGLGGMSRAGDQIPGLAALDLHWNCNENCQAGGVGS